MEAGRAAREAALAILQGVRAGYVWDDVLTAAIAPLKGDDARLAHEIAAGVLRMRRPLDERLSALASAWETTSDDLKDLARIGAFQLLVLDRVPPYAAVQTTVEAAKHAVGVGGSRFVNAILRRLATGGAVTTNFANGFATHPDWLITRWTARFGVEATARLLEHNDERPDMTLVPYRWTVDQLAQALTHRDIPFRPAAFGTGLVVATGRASDFPGFAEGAFLVQDAAQSALLEFARLPSSSMIWDACAAPGGKALCLARSGVVLATDLRSARVTRLRESSRRCGAEMLVAVADARRSPFRDEQFDAVLVDAPCTATGTMRRHPDARWRLDARMITRAAELQRTILDGAAPAVRRRGVLVYLTCSLEPEENDEQVEAFLSRHPNFRRTAEDRFLFPPDRGTDGGFGARLERVA